MIEASIGEIEFGRIFDAVVKSVLAFGAIVDVGYDRTGLVHISELSNEGIEPSMVVKEGQIVKVKFIGTDERGRFKFSLKAVNQETGEDISNGEYQQNEQPVANRSKSEYKKPRRGFENGRTNYARKEFVKKTNKRKVEKGDKSGKQTKKKGLLSSLLKRRK